MIHSDSVGIGSVPGRNAPALRAVANGYQAASRSGDRRA